MEKVQTKAMKIREFMTNNPSATIEDIVKATNANKQYIYDIRSKLAGKKKKKAKVTRGQTILRKILSENNSEDKPESVNIHPKVIDEFHKTIQELKKELSSTYAVIRYLEHRLETVSRGATV